MFPHADIFTLLHAEGMVSSLIERHRILTSRIHSLPFAKSHYRYYLPLFPWAIEAFDLRGYDVVLSSSHCVAKGVRTSGDTAHVAYIHAPMRYVWDQYDAYFGKGRSSMATRLAMSLVRKSLQRWDLQSSSGPHRFVANSKNIAKKIQQYYGRESVVVYPPVNWASFAVSSQREDYYLMVTAFAPYKRIDIAIQACNHLRRKLTIIGSGQEEVRLRAVAGPTISFMGWQPDDVVRYHYQHCRGLLFPGEEDFGIVPLEVMACGKPVIAYGRGGVLETVVPLNPPINDRNSSLCGPKEMPSGGSQVPTGVFFYEQSVDALVDTIQAFESHEGAFNPQAIRAHVEQFDREHFKERMGGVIAEALETRSAVT
jgi:glycosyltransferase involved in cell wall biosynthesis